MDGPCGPELNHWYLSAVDQLHEWFERSEEISQGISCHRSRSIPVCVPVRDHVCLRIGPFQDGVSHVSAQFEVDLVIHLFVEQMRENAGRREGDVDDAVGEKALHQRDDVDRVEIHAKMRDFSDVTQQSDDLRQHDGIRGE